MKKKYSKLFGNSSDTGNNMGRLFFETLGISEDTHKSYNTIKSHKKHIYTGLLS